MLKFPDSLVFKTLYSHCRGAQAHSLVGDYKIPHAVGHCPLPQKKIQRKELLSNM